VPPAPHPEPHPDVVHMPAAELDALRDAATAPERYAAQQAAAEHEQLVIAAVRDGRIEPRHRDSWLQVLNADPAAIVDLLGLPTGRSDIPLDEIATPATETTRTHSPGCGPGETEPQRAASSQLNTMIMKIGQHNP